MLFKTVGVATSKSLICRCCSTKCNFTLKVFFTEKMAISRDRLILTWRLLRRHLVSLFLNILLIQILMRESLHMCLKLGCLLQNQLIWMEASRVHATIEVRTGLALAWNCLILTHRASVTPLRHVWLSIEVLMAHFLAILRVHYIEILVVHLLHAILVQKRVINFLVRLLGTEGLGLVEVHLVESETRQPWVLSNLTFIAVLILKEILLLQLRQILATFHWFLLLESLCRHLIRLWQGKVLYFWMNFTLVFHLFFSKTYWNSCQKLSLNVSFEL